MIHADALAVDSPLHRQLTVTVFDSHTANVKREHKKSLADLAPYIDRKSAPTKGALPWLKLAKFGDKRTDKNSLRSDANVLSVDGIEIDYDGGQISVDQAAELFQVARVAALVYTSPSHSDAQPRWRALLPLSKTLPPARRERLCGIVNRIVGGVASGESFTVSQSYYYGRVKANPDHQVRLVDGRYIDYATEIEPLAKARLAPLTRNRLSNGADSLDEWGLGTDRIEISDHQLHQLLISIPNDGAFDERGEWFQVGCAVSHQATDPDIAHQIFHDWSHQHSSHNEAKFEKTWKSIGNYTGRPITARYLVKLANFYKQKAVTQQLLEVLSEIDLAADLTRLKEAAKAARKLDLDVMDRSRLVASVQKAAKQLGVTLSLKDAREMVRYQPDFDVPEWLASWVYLKHTGQFYDRQTGERIDRNAFDAAFGRYVAPDTLASRFALNVIKIPVYHMTIYLPGDEGAFIDASGLTWINTYRDTAPPIPLELTERDRRNLEIVKHHSRHLFEDDRDIRLLESSLAYVVQTGRRCNWITIIQGAEAIGKTFYAQMMAAVLGGSPHTYKLDTETLIKSPFTEWAEGHQITFIEELKVHGHRYDVLDRLKTYITDETVSVHPKGVKQYNAINTATYMAFTNHRDSVPLERGDTRYVILLSRWQSDKEVKKFKAENPDYYRDLFQALQESPGAIRQWLLNYTLHPEFNPMARAPSSHGKDTMINESKSELQIAVEDLIEDGNIPGISEDLIVVHILREALADESGMLPDQQATISVLKRLQFTPVKGRRVKMSDPRKDYYCWSANPQILAADTMRMREIIMDKIVFHGL